MTDIATIAPAALGAPALQPVLTSDPAAPIPAATSAPAAVASLLDTETPDEAIVVEAPETLEGEPVEKPEWARPDDPEAAEAWREERGVPLEPDDYELPIADPDQLDDSAQQTISGFQKMAFDLDLPQESASKMYEFATTRAQEIMAARIEQDRAEVASAKRILAEQWGADAGNNLKAVNALLNEFPSGLSKAIRDARSGNGLGSRLTNDAAFLSMLSEYAALKAGGPTAGIFDGQADEKRITEIKRQRSDDVSTYFRHGLSNELATLEARQAARLPGQEGPRPNDAAREALIKAAMRKNFEEYAASSMPAELAAIYKRRGAV